MKYGSYLIIFPSSPLPSNGSGVPLDNDPPLHNTNYPLADPLSRNVVPLHSTSYETPTSSHIIYAPALSPPHFTHPSPGSRTSPTSPISPLVSPTNSVGSNLDFLLQRNTIHKPLGSSFPHISPSLAGNITVCKKQNHDNKHF